MQTVHTKSSVTTPDPSFRRPGRKHSVPSAKQQQGTNFQASDPAALQTGMQVEHPKFGKGKIVALEGQGPNKKATVFFNGIGNKNLLLRFAKLRILS